jgi:5'-nucleotidase
MTRLLPGLAAFAAAMLVALLGLYAKAGTPEPRREEPWRGLVTLRLLGVNDFHGHLEPPRPGIGGAAWLKSHLDRATLPGRTIRVHAGDMVGATPLISAGSTTSRRSRPQTRSASMSARSETTNSTRAAKS